MAYNPGVGAGDRVKINMTIPNDLNGRYGVVKHVNLGARRIAVSLDNDIEDETYRYFSAEELIKEPKKFILGDRVRVLDSDPCYAGQCGVVYAFRGGSIEVRLDMGKSTYIFTKDLQHETETIFRVGTIPTNRKEAEMTKNGLQVGDRIHGMFGGNKKYGTISRLTLPDLPDSMVGVRFDGYTYGSDTDYHSQQVAGLTKMEELRFKKGDWALVGKLDDLSTPEMRNLVGRAGQINSVRLPVPSDPVKEPSVYIAFDNEAGSYVFRASSLLGIGDVIPDRLRGSANLEKTPRKMRELGTGYGASEKMFKGVWVQRTTVSATIVLSSGREVRMPDPGETWELTERIAAGPSQRIQIGEGTLHLGGANHGINHVAGRCWLKDMARIVNQTERVDHFTERYAYVTELRCFRERPPKDKEAYTNADSVLAVLW